jgi:hypothetical protein
MNRPELPSSVTEADETGRALIETKVWRAFVDDRPGADGANDQEKP